MIEGEDTNQTWIIDPLDGTSNFLHGIPQFAITVALKMGEEIIAGVTYDPIKDEMFWSEKGKGAYLNQRRIRVSARRHLDEALVGMGTPYRHAGNPEIFKRRLSSMVNNTAGIRQLGAHALDLAYVACGRFDVFFEEPMNLWDYAAGVLFIQEAGGTVTTISGDKDVLDKSSILAGNPQLHKSVFELL